MAIQNKNVVLQHQTTTDIDAVHTHPFQTLYTVEQFADKQPAFSASALRNLIFKAESRKSWNGEISGNGLIEYGAIIRVGRKVLIDGERFLEWVRQQNNGRK